MDRATLGDRVQWRGTTMITARRPESAVVSDRVDAGDAASTCRASRPIPSQRGPDLSNLLQDRFQHKTRARRQMPSRRIDQAQRMGWSRKVAQHANELPTTQVIEHLEQNEKGNFCQLIPRQIFDTCSTWCHRIDQKPNNDRWSCMFANVRLQRSKRCRPKSAGWRIVAFGVPNSVVGCDPPYRGCSMVLLAA
jgi:hypothetical protein